mmetsp:Transcript_21382/g.25754  ORF Transcript_21382/g.25754 Transcript_21382/m.25754 type:complete len:376 (+) Transcript_21382:151-1278(+)|eukprot:CAMPEP_0197858422 /NCGR_PEP_ID=MMETSP1438-20131217/32217_1 /TAXON_ID=1461541 /ORGANISM="Pterosperma sp., Strain CCMP1384" /LENGTH=375 /DNA_ID=CAMNT_0043474577 /DNA_START=142 /DNA_END=1269 /DNA_ORIENTATION=-
MSVAEQTTPGRDEVKFPPIPAPKPDSAATSTASSRKNLNRDSKKYNQGKTKSSRHGINQQDPSQVRTRSVKGIVFRSINEPPFEINPMQLLVDVSKRIRLPRRDGFRTFKLTLKCPLSCQILTTFFWYLHCTQYQDESNGVQKQLLNHLSEKYVALFWSFSGAQRDFFLEYYPFAVASATCAAFIESYPASRAEFTEAFKNRVFQEARMMFSGVETSLEAMQLLRERMALDSSGFGRRDDGMDRSGGMGNRHAAHHGDDGMDRSADGNEVSERQEQMKIPGFIERKQQRPKRVIFDAMGTSPLIRHYISQISDANAASHKALLLKRTTPTPGCAIGGEDTFERTPSRVDIQDEIHRKWYASRDSAAQNFTSLSDI